VADSPVSTLQPLEDPLRETEALLREAQSEAHVGSWSVQLGGDVVMSQAGRDVYGFTPHEPLRQQDLEELIHPDDRIRVLHDSRAALHGSAIAWQQEFRIVRRDGSVRWLQLRSRILREESGRPVRVVGVTQDITQRRHSIEQLQASEERYRQIAAVVEWSNDAIIGCAVDGTISSWNRGATRLFGYDESEALLRSDEMLLPDVLVDEARLLLARVRHGEVVENHATVRRRKDGTNIEVLLTISPVLDAHGAVVGISNIARDLTSQRAAESALRKAEEQLREAQKLEAVGLLAGGIAHDFNNMLSVIVGYTELVLDSLPANDTLRSDVLEVRKAGASAVALTKQLLAFSRRQVLQPRVIDLNTVVLGLERMLRRLLPAHVELRYELAPGLGRVSADPGQLEQVVINLVLNARDAMPSAGTLTLSTENRALFGLDRARLDVVEGRYVVLSISDTGCGIDPALRARIFEPFFTTKEKGKGTGLGLSTTLGIVRQSGGAIDVTSRVGVGTTFHVYLPRTERPIHSNPSTPPSRTRSGGWETVLVVEDEEQVRALARTVLDREGYRVIEAENGEQALSALEEHGGEIHLILTDVVMPRMGGNELIARVRERRPELKVLFMSGYADHELLPAGIIDPDVALLAKPITPSSLSRKVREVLDTE
jgi:two-component system, cell cycle sensor histidine kinase and response regulator CckA